MHKSMTLQGPEVTDVPVLQAAALPKLDAGFGFLSAPVVEQAPVPPAPVMGSPAQPAQAATVAAPAQDTSQASPASTPALPGAPPEPADPQHRPSGLRTAVPEAAVGSEVPAWEPTNVDRDGAPVTEPAWVPFVVGQGGVHQSEAGPGSRPGSQQAALSSSQVSVSTPPRETACGSAATAALQRQVKHPVLCFAEGEGCAQAVKPPKSLQAPLSSPTLPIYLQLLQHDCSLQCCWPLKPHVLAHVYLQELQQRRLAALNRVTSALASPIQQQQVQQAVGSASWPAPADASRPRRTPSPEARPGLPGLQLSIWAPEPPRSASPQAQGQGLSIGSVPAGRDGRPTADQQASRRSPGALEWAAGWGRHQLEAGQQAAPQAAPFGRGSPRLQVQPAAYVLPSPHEGQGQEESLPCFPQWQQEEEAQAEGLWGAGPRQGLPGGGLFGWHQPGSPHSLQPQPSALQQLIVHQAATMQVRPAVQQQLLGNLGSAPCRRTML